MRNAGMNLLSSRQQLAPDMVAIAGITALVVMRGFSAETIGGATDRPR